MAAPTVESCIDTFPHVTIPKQQGELTREKMHISYEFLSANSSSIEYSIRIWTHGLLDITQEPKNYLTLTGHVLMLPTNPGPAPVIPEEIRPVQVTVLENWESTYNLKQCLKLSCST